MPDIYVGPEESPLSHIFVFLVINMIFKLMLKATINSFGVFVLMKSQYF